MIKKAVFFMFHPFNDRDYKRFGGEILTNNGFEVVFFEFSRLLAPSLLEKGVKRDRREGALVFNTWEEAKDAISQLSEECFVFCICGYRQKTLRIYRTLSRTKAPYSLTVTNAIPCCKTVERLLQKISHITLPKLANLLKKYAFQPTYAKYLGIRAPDLLLAGGTKSLDHPHVGLIGKKTEILWSHTLDYDIYLEIIDSNVSPQYTDNCGNCGTAVFLAPPGPLFLRDDLASGTKSPLTAEKYYPSLCNFFNMIEKELGVKVEIAGHPGSDHEGHPDCFGRRLTLYGQTIQMVRKSKFVITRDSTAINFAVLFKKAVVFITTDEAESDYPLSSSIHTMASSLGKIPINVDHTCNINWDKELSIDEKAYSNYKDCYIKRPGSEDLNSWQIVANRLKNW